MHGSINSPIDDTLTHRDLVLRPAFHSCKWNGHEIRLTRAQYAGLLALTRHPGMVLSREQLLDCMARSLNVYDRAINGHVRRLREKFRKVDPTFDLIETLYGVGYRLKE